MQCYRCGHKDQSGKFCVKCGANLEAAASVEAINPYDRQAVPPLEQDSAYRQSSPQEQDSAYRQSPPLEQDPAYRQSPPLDQDQPYRQPPYDRTASYSQANPQLQQMKTAGRQYFSHFVQTLKNPVRSGQSTDASHMANGLITLVLFCLLLPLIAYFQLQHSVRGFSDFLGSRISVPFGAIVVKPFFFLLIVLMLVNSLQFLVLKWGKVDIRYQEVAARFGTFLMPGVAFLAGGFLLSLLGIGSALPGWLTAIGVFTLFVAVCFTIFSFKKDNESGLDAFYGVVITYAGSIVLLYLFGDNLLSGFFRGIGGVF